MIYIVRFFCMEEVCASASASASAWSVKCILTFHGTVLVLVSASATLHEKSTKTTSKIKKQSQDIKFINKIIIIYIGIKAKVYIYIYILLYIYMYSVCIFIF